MSVINEALEADPQAQTFDNSNTDPHNKMISEIMNMQNSGQSKSSKIYSEDELHSLPPDRLRAVHNDVKTGIYENKAWLRKPTLLEQMRWDEEIDEVLDTYNTSQHPVNIILSVIKSLNPGPDDINSVAQEVPHLANEPEFSNWYNQAKREYYGLDRSFDRDDSDYTDTTMRRGELGDYSRDLIPESELDEEGLLLEKSSLNGLIGKQPGGQKLIKWLHGMHRLSSVAEYTPVRFAPRVFWKQFKANPDNFVIVSAKNGVAGVKPSLEYIQHMIARKKKEGTSYNPSTDPNLRYQAIAFTDKGDMIDPKLLQAKSDGKAEPAFKTKDPTVIKARMGLVKGRDMQNPDNIFNLLEDQIGELISVFISGFENIKDSPPGPGSLERGKMSKRDEYKHGPAMTDAEAISQFITKQKSLLQTVGKQALNRIRAGADANPEKYSSQQSLIDNFLTSADTMHQIVASAVAKTSEYEEGSPQHNQWIKSLAAGNSVAVKNVLNAIRTELTGE